jgi:hypothetical protein
MSSFAIQIEGDNPHANEEMILRLAGMATDLYLRDQAAQDLDVFETTTANPIEN